jgi:hypothetical protein
MLNPAASLPPPDANGELDDARYVAYQAVLAAMGSDHVAFWPGLVERLGSPSAALLLSQIFYWTERLKDRRGSGVRFSNSDGWFYKSLTELTHETAMGRRELEAARRVLMELGLLECFVGGMPRVTYYRLNLVRVGQLIGSGKSTGSEFSRDVINRLLGRPLLLNRTLARLCGGIHPGLYLSFVITEIRTQLRVTESGSSWTLKQPLSAIFRKLRFTQRQAEYCRAHLRRLGILDEWRSEMPITSKCRVNWQKLAWRLENYVTSESLKLPISKEQTAELPLFSANANPEIAPKPAPIHRSQETCYLDGRKPAIWTLQNVPTGHYTTAQLDFTQCTDWIRQNVLTQMAKVSDPLTNIDYSYKPPPTSPDGDLSPEEGEDIGIAEPAKPEATLQNQVAVASLDQPDLILSQCIPPHLHNQVRLLVAPLLKARAGVSAQQVVDELTGRIRLTPRLGPVDNQIGYLRRLVKKAENGSLSLELAFNEQALRQQKAIDRAATTNKLPEIPRTPELEAAIEKFRSLRKKLSGRS